MEAVLVLPEWMPERLLEAAPGLELGIDAFVACPGIGSGSRVLERDDMPWSSASWMIGRILTRNDLSFRRDFGPFSCCVYGSRVRSSCALGIFGFWVLHDRSVRFIVAGLGFVKTACLG